MKSVHYSLLLERNPRRNIVVSMTSNTRLRHSLADRYNTVTV